MLQPRLKTDEEKKQQLLVQNRQAAKALLTKTLARIEANQVAYCELGRKIRG
jgi:hypothetical protein